jgi:2-amino-4-hydroxy-6-hydroxymethyldihydropteridine diphosphokinase
MTTPATSWTPVYVGIGSNLDDPRAQVVQACTLLAGIPDSRLVSRSSLYRTPPFGPIAQPDFVNAVAALLTQLPPHAFLSALKQIEARMGRTAPKERWGPRRIDLDLLVYGSREIADPGLTVPHPGIAERAFVLVPLCEVAPDLQVPRLGRVAALRARVDASAVVRLDEQRAGTGTVG